MNTGTGRRLPSAGRSLLVAVVSAFIWLPGFAISEPAKWGSFPIYEWETADFDGPRKESTYTPLDGASESWQICVLIPHLKDAYWLAVNFGLVQEAERLGVALSIHSAGGYDRLDRQIAQAEECLARDPDALIVSAVEESGLNTVLDNAARNDIPIVDLINGLTFQRISARSAGDYYDSAYLAARYLVERHAGEDRDILVAWFPGPKLSAWAQRGNQGFAAGIEGSNVTIVATEYGDTGRQVQGDLIERVLDRYGSVDYIVGTTVSAEVATGILRRRGLEEATDIVAYYFGPGVYRGIRRGTILAAPSDQQAIQGRIAVDQAVRLLQGAPLQRFVGPKVRMLDRDSLQDFDLSSTMAPIGFRPTFDVN